MKYHSSATTTPSAPAMEATSTAATSEPATSAVTGSAAVTELLGLSAGPVAPEGVIVATAVLTTFIAVAAHRIVPWIERWLVVEGVAPSRRGIVGRVPAKLGWPIHRRIAVLKSRKLVRFWKGWFFEVARNGNLTRGGRVIWPGAGVVEGAIAARIRRTTSTRVWPTAGVRWTNSTSVRWTTASVSWSVVTASITRRYGVGVGNVNVAIITDVAATPIAAPIVVIVVD